MSKGAFVLELQCVRSVGGGSGGRTNNFLLRPCRDQSVNLCLLIFKRKPILICDL